METTLFFWGLYRGYIGIMEKKMETTIVYWGYIGDILDFVSGSLVGITGVITCLVVVISRLLEWPSKYAVANVPSSPRPS